MGQTDILQPLLFLGLPTAVIVLVVVLRFLARQRLLDLVREAVAQDKPLTPDVLAALIGDNRTPAQRDRRRGTLLIAIGVGLGLLGLFAAIGIERSGLEGGPATGMILAGLGVMPLCIGVALVLLAWTQRS